MTVHLDQITLKNETAVPLLTDVSASFSSDEFAVLVGKNGAGKSLLLRTIVGLEKPDQGKVWWSDDLLAGPPKKGAPIQQKVGLVLQDAEKQVLCNIVRDDLSLSLEMQGIAASEHDARIAALAQMIPIDHLLDRNITTLSGGERRLIAIATVVICNPCILFLDEPFQSLDHPACLTLLQALLTIHKSGVGIVLVTHAYHMVLAHAQRMLVMDAGELKHAANPEAVLPKLAAYGLESPHLPLDQMSILLQKNTHHP